MEKVAIKKNIRLTARLQTACGMLPNCKTLVDVGCDHGKLGVSALLNGQVQGLLAIDISAASLKKAKKFAQQFGLSAEFICADGLTSLEMIGRDPYVIAILGMGGELIADILVHGISIAKKADAIVLQPMGGESELRKWLFVNGFAITDENVIRDKQRYYQLIATHYLPAEVQPYTDEALLEFGALCYAKRQDALRGLLERVRSSREKRMERAKNDGVIPEALRQELDGVIRLLKYWEDHHEFE